MMVMDTKPHSHTQPGGRDEDEEKDERQVLFTLHLLYSKGQEPSAC